MFSEFRLPNELGDDILVGAPNTPPAPVWLPVKDSANQSARLPSSVSSAAKAIIPVPGAPARSGLWGRICP
jgi:hypothetical protein